MNSPSNPEVVYIELAQNDSNSVKDSGDYSISIDRPISISEGDSISLYKSFIDTTPQSQLIVLETDIQLDLQFVKYIRNWCGACKEQDINTQSKDLTTDGLYLGFGDRQISGIPDNLDYIVAKITPQGGAGPVVTTMTNIFYGKIRRSKKHKFAGGFTGVYSYLDASGVRQRVSLLVPREDTEDGARSIGVPNLKILCRPNSFIDETGLEVLENAGCPPDTFPASFTYSDPSGTPIAEDYLLEPEISTVSLRLNAGVYDPSTIALRITESLTNCDGNVSGASPAGNSFITSSNELGMVNAINGTTSDGAFKNSEHCCVRGGNSVYIPVSGGRDAGGGSQGSGLNYIIGASQVALEYQDNAIFSWSFLHTPFYVGDADTTKNIGLAYIQKKELPRVTKPDGSDEIENPEEGLYEAVSKYGGIAFTSLTAYKLGDDGTFDSQKDAIDFWEKELKFNVGLMTIKFDSVDNLDLRDSDGIDLKIKSFFPYRETGTVKVIEQPTFYYSVNDEGENEVQPQNVLLDGVTTTGGLISLDATIDKSSDNPFGFTAFGNTPIEQQTEITGTIGIPALNPYESDDALESPFFRLEVECGAKNTLIGEKRLFKNTIGIVGRYYESNSYNTGTASDSFVYIHKGLPMTLSSFNIRVLDENGLQPNGIGDNNTIFLQVVKNNQNNQNNENTQKKRK